MGVLKRHKNFHCMAANSHSGGPAEKNLIPTLTFWQQQRPMPIWNINWGVWSILNDAGHYFSYCYRQNIATARKSKSEEVFFRQTSIYFPIPISCWSYQRVEVGQSFFFSRVARMANSGCRMEVLSCFGHSPYFAGSSQVNVFNMASQFTTLAVEMGFFLLMSLMLTVLNSKYWPLALFLTMYLKMAQSGILSVVQVFSSRELRSELQRCFGRN